jgi:hypothetical protein
MLRIYEYMRLFQNFSFWNSNLRFRGKTGLLAGFSKSLFQTNQVLEQAHIIKELYCMGIKIFPQKQSFLPQINLRRRRPCRLKFTPSPKKHHPKRRRMGFAHPPPQTNFIRKKYKNLYSRHCKTFL